jgi:holo-[acyl-carrier protein] synthase
MIVGVGIDMIEVDRVIAKIDKNKGFKEMVFSKAEIDFCECHRRAEDYAARFAAKEAFLKATGLGLLLGHELSEVEVINDINGKPSLDLKGNFKIKAKENGWNKIHLSLSHLHHIASAVVIIEQ